MIRTVTLRRLLLATAAGVLLAAAAGTPAGAQTASGPGGGGGGRPAAQALQEGVQVRILGDGDGAAAAGDNPAGRPAVDESALRYYAARGERERVNAEIARLRALHPGWEPPADLWGPVHRVDERPLWRLYDGRDYDGVRAEIERLRRTNPGWEPPTRLLALMEENEVRARLQATEAAGDWAGLLEIARTHPTEVACSRIDNMWRVAQAQAETGRRDAAFGTYGRIITDCADLDHRIATLQKARGRVSAEQLERLFALEDGRTKSAEEQAKVAAVQHSLTAAARPSAPAVNTAIQRLFRPGLTRAQAERAEPDVLRERHARGAEQLGWFYYEAGDPERAVAWFRRAHGWAPGTKTAEGLALSHAELGQFDEVERIARQWPRQLGGVLDSLRARRIATAYEGGDHATVLALTEDAGRASELMLRGWSLMTLQRPTEALAAFEAAAAGAAGDPAVRSDALYASALAYLATNTLREAVAVSETQEVGPEHRREIRALVLARQAALAMQRGDYMRALDYLKARYAFAEPSRELLIQEAWVRYHLKQPVQAERIFVRLHRALATPETTEGLRVTRSALDGVEYGPQPTRGAGGRYGYGPAPFAGRGGG